jgi:hypothetical protein
LNSEIESRRQAVVAPTDLNEEEAQLLDVFENESETTKKKDHRSLSLYRRFVWRFVFVVSFLALLVFYFSFSKLTIDIIPKGESLNESLLLKISSATSSLENLIDPRENINGEVKDVPIEIEKSFQASGEEFVGETISGRVKIINNYGKSQALVATTRILSPDNKMFRLKEAVTIPAGGEVWADIYVEKPSREFAIDPSTFTIPGLWVGLQDKIYAKSETAFVFEQKNDKYVKASDIALAEKEIGDEFAKAVKTQIEEQRLNLSSVTGEEKEAIYLLDDEIVVKSEAKIDDRVSSFKARAKGTVRVAFFSAKQVSDLALSKLNLLIPDDKELLEFDSNSIIYSFESYDEETKSATIKASFPGKMVLKGDQEVVDKESLVNLSGEQIKAYLISQPEVKDFELKFSPSFIKRAPRLVDRIDVNLISE